MLKKTFILDNRLWLMNKNTRAESITMNSVPGAIYHKDKKKWSLPLNDYSVDIARANGYFVDYHKEIRETKDFTPPSGLTLYPFQVDGYKRIIELGCNALLADEMGLGKSCQALACLGAYRDLRPALIVVPASLKINWERETNKWLPGEKVDIINGTTSSIPYEPNIMIINYDIIKYYVELIEDVKVMILDEVHMIKNFNSQRTKAVRYIGMKINHIIALSGTPITNRPAEFFTILNLLDKNMFNNRERFLYDYCNKAKDGTGKGACNTDKLHKILATSFMIRRLTKDVLPDLPKNKRQVICFPLDNREEYDYARRDLISFLRETENKHISYYAIALVRFEKLKQLAIKGKMKYIFEWIGNFLKEKNKLVIICTHTNTINNIMNRYQKIAVKHNGEMTEKQKKESEDRFQTDDKIKLFVGNNISSGQGLTLTAAYNLAIIELPWTPGNCRQIEKRINRIGQTKETNSYYLITENTIEEDIADIIDGKQKILDAILDGKETEEESLIKTLIERYKNYETSY